MGVDLPLVWAVIILFGIMMYVVMDGFDLGIGILFPLVADDEDRDVMMNSVAPVWDGNETWLVLGGAGLLAAFPLAYSVILSAFYLPLILMPPRTSATGGTRPSPADRSRQPFSRA